MSSILRVLVLILILFSAVFLACNPLPERLYSPGSDEGYYFHYANIVKDKGVAGFRELVHWYANSNEARKHPAPSRLGFILLNAGLFKIAGPSYSVMGASSFAFFLLFLGINFWFIRKYLHLDIALLTTLLLASSPLLLAMSRRALADSHVNLTWGLAVWLFLDYLAERRRGSYLLFILSLFLALMIKESAVFLIPFFLIAGLTYKYYLGKDLKVSCLMGMIIWPLVLSLVSYLLVLGWDGLQTLGNALINTHLKDQSNIYAVVFSSGPWYRYLVDFLLMSPWVTLLFIGYFFNIVASRTQDWKTSYFWLYFVVLYGILSSLPHSKVVRFAINLEMVMALFAVFMLYRIFESLEKTRQAKCVAYLCIAIFLFNFMNFIQLFFPTTILDPITYNLLIVLGFIPG